MKIPAKKALEAIVYDPYGRPDQQRSGVKDDEEKVPNWYQGLQVLKEAIPLLKEGLCLTQQQVDEIKAQISSVYGQETSTPSEVAASINAMQLECLNEEE